MHSTSLQCVRNVYFWPLSISAHASLFFQLQKHVNLIELSKSHSIFHSCLIAHGKFDKLARIKSKPQKQCQHPKIPSRKKITLWRLRNFTKTLIWTNKTKSSSRYVCLPYFIVFVFAKFFYSMFFQHSKFDGLTLSILDAYGFLADRIWNEAAFEMRTQT